MKIQILKLKYGIIPASFNRIFLNINSLTFHSLNFRLSEEPVDRFDPKICRQHLQDCLKKVLRCYDHLDESSGSKDNLIKATKHREFIESVYLLFNLGSGEVLARAIQVPKQYK